MNIRTLLLIITCGTLPFCSLGPLDGTGTGSGWETRAAASGTIVREDGSPAPNTIVSLIPEGFDPGGTGVLPYAMNDTTDASGTYMVRCSDPGIYNIQAVQRSERTRLFIRKIIIGKDTVAVPTDTLHRPGAIRVRLPDSADLELSYIYVPGSAIFSRINDASGYIFLDSVPRGIMPAVFYNVQGRRAQKALRLEVPVTSGDTTVVDNPQWLYSKKLYLNTTQTGAGIPDNVIDFPVLIRFAADNFRFNEARADGRDVFFTKADNTLLSGEIEQWDSAGARAALWVRLDTIYGNSENHFVMMYWGNISAPKKNDPATVFDTAKKFQGVWHLGESGGPVAGDATPNNYYGSMKNTATADGVIGRAQRFDGTSSFIQMVGTAYSRLNLPENGQYTISAWVYADTFDDSWHMIAGKGHLQYYLKLNPIDDWEFVEYHDKVGWQGIVAKATERSWKYLVGKRDKDRQYLFLDGMLVDSVFKVAADTLSRTTVNDFSIGRYLESVSQNNGFAGFKGLIDEVRVSTVPNSADWIRLCYMNQKPDGDALVKFK